MIVITFFQIVICFHIHRITPKLLTLINLLIEILKPAPFLVMLVFSYDCVRDAYKCACIAYNCSLLFMFNVTYSVPMRSRDKTNLALNAAKWLLQTLNTAL